MDFRLGTHTITGEPMVEVWRDGEFVASICSNEAGLNIHSKYFDGVKIEQNGSFPPSVLFRLSDTSNMGARV